MPADEDCCADPPDWELVEPEKYLVELYFRSDKPDWISAVQEIIDDGRKNSRKTLSQKVLSEREILSLNHIVARFIKARVDYAGWLNMTCSPECPRSEVSSVPGLVLL
jgi:hypothetical protein